MHEFLIFLFNLNTAVALFFMKNSAFLPEYAISAWGKSHLPLISAVFPLEQTNKILPA